MTTTKITLIAEELSKDGKTVSSTILSSNDVGATWGPQVGVFERFLKAQGFMFYPNEALGFLDDKDNFRGADSL